MPTNEVTPEIEGRQHCIVPSAHGDEPHPDNAHSPDPFALCGHVCFQERAEQAEAKVARLSSVMEADADKADSALRARDEFWKGEVAAKVRACICLPLPGGV